jgi:hypothetical protein
VVARIHKGYTSSQVLSPPSHNFSLPKASNWKLCGKKLSRDVSVDNIVIFILNDLINNGHDHLNNMLLVPE